MSGKYDFGHLLVTTFLIKLRVLVFLTPFCFYMIANPYSMACNFTANEVQGWTSAYKY